jgi:hypothetical protein
VRHKQLEAVFFESGVIVVVQVVETDYIIPSGKELEGCVEPDETGAAGYQDPRHRYR